MMHNGWLACMACVNACTHAHDVKRQLAPFPNDRMHFFSYLEESVEMVWV